MTTMKRKKDTETEKIKRLLETSDSSYCKTRNNNDISLNSNPFSGESNDNND